MESLNNTDLIAAGALVIGVLGFMFGIYKHFSTRKISNLFYEINQLSDYDVPESFIMGVPKSLISINIENAGNKQAQDIQLNLKTKSRIDNHEVTPATVQSVVEDLSLKIDLDKLNPSQRLKLKIYCDGSAVIDQVELFELTHSEGQAINKKSRAFTSIDFSIVGIGFTFDLGNRSIRLR